VSERDDAMGRTFLQRVGDNNKLWLGTAIVLVVLSMGLLIQAKRAGAPKDSDQYSPPAVRPDCSYDDSKHVAFAERFIAGKEAAGKLVDAHFAPADVASDGDRFIIVLASDTSVDDIEYLSQIAAEKNLAEFKTRIKVIAYQAVPGARSGVLVATTKWVKSRYGFVTTFVDRTD